MDHPLTSDLYPLIAAARHLAELVDVDTDEASDSVGRAR